MDEVMMQVSGEYTNIYENGNLRVSMSEEHDEVLVYSDDCDEPMGKFHLDGTPKME